MENGGGKPAIGEAESVEKPGMEVSQPEEEEENPEDGIFSPVRIPGEDDVRI